MITCTTKNIGCFYAGYVSSLVYFVGSTGEFPISVTSDCPWSNAVCYRTGDYSAIVYADDGLVYGASQHSQKTDGPASQSVSSSWGATHLLDVLLNCFRKHQEPCATAAAPWL
jgi:hypothetical protein